MQKPDGTYEIIAGRENIVSGHNLMNWKCCNNDISLCKSKKSAILFITK